MTVRPSNSSLGNFAASQADVDGQFTVREVALGGHDLTRDLATILGPQVDPGSDGVRITAPPDYLQPDPVIAQGLVITEQQWRSLDLGHDYVEVSIPIKICIGRPPTHDRLEQVFTRFCGCGADKGLVASAVPKELRRLPVVDIGLHLLDLLFDVYIGGEYIQPAIQVVVEEEKSDVPIDLVED